MEDWATELARGRLDTAWDRFLDRYRRLIFAAIRHYARDHDDVMDVFARVCEALRDSDLKRLRAYFEQPEHPARFSTWLVTVVRNITIDWFRHRDGRRRLSTTVERLPPLERQIFELVFLERRSHLEAYELVCARRDTPLSFHDYTVALCTTYQALQDGRRGRLLRELGGPMVVEPEPEPDASGEPLGLRELLEPVLATLSPQDRAAVELYVVEELTAEEVARIVGFPNAKAVYNHVRRALAALRSTLEETGVRREDVL